MIKVSIWRKALFAGGFMVALALLLNVVAPLRTSAIAPVDCAKTNASGLGVKTATSRLKLEPNTEIKRYVKVKNEGCSEISFTVKATPYAPAEDYSNAFNIENRWTQISRHISFEQDKYTLAVGETVDVAYVITVPSNDEIAAGGQYAAIAITGEKRADSGVNILPSIMYLVFGQMDGEVREDAQVSEQSIPFWTAGDSNDCKDDDANCGGLETRFAVKNGGNVDFSAYGRLTVKGLFGNEIYITGEKNRPHVFAFPETTPPEKTVNWKDARIGLYRVTQSVEINGKSHDKTSLVLVAPVWLLIVMLIGLLAIIFVIVNAILRRRKRKKSSLRRK